MTVPSFAATFTKSKQTKQTQPSLSAIGNLVTPQSSTPHLSSSSSSAIGNSSSTSKSSSRGRRAASASSLTDKTAATNQSTSSTNCAPSRSWRRSDPPEPSTGLRRSQRLKETTGSCASNRYMCMIVNITIHLFSKSGICYPCNKTIYIIQLSCTLQILIF